MPCRFHDGRMSLSTTPPLSGAPAVRPASRTSPGTRPHRRGFWIISYVFAVTMATGSAPAPLYVLYQQRDGFGSFTVTLVFAVYALGVVTSLIAAGHLSDTVGRRRVMAASGLLALLALLIFMAWAGLPGLLLARFVSGLGIGVLASTATAYLTELHRRGSPRTAPRRAEVTAIAANVGGIGLGPFTAGLLAEYAPHPLRTPFLAFTFLLLVGGLALLTVPETVVRAQPRARYRTLRPKVPKATRRAYAVAIMMAFVASAMFGFFISLAPVFLSTHVGIRSPAVTGLVAFLVFATAAVIQMLSSRWPPRRQHVVGIAMLGTGIVVVTVAFAAVSLPSLLVGGMVVGAGAGATYKAAIGAVITMSAPGIRGENLAGLFLGGYAGMSLPVVGLGLLLEVVSLTSAVITFGVVMGLLLLTTSLASPRARPAGAVTLPIPPRRECADA